MNSDLRDAIEAEERMLASCERARNIITLLPFLTLGGGFAVWAFSQFF